MKKDDKGPPEDVFEPLLVESKQANTVVLMLESPEDDVLAKACEAIYKFVEKCDENKKLLLDLHAVDHLLKLVQHEERIVRRNAIMALGVMAAHVEVRKSLRSRGETIPAVVNLLAPEEDTVVHEFAALCLTSLAIDYTSKVTICEQDALEPLIRCLGSHDPDVQKNSIETIALLLQDYQAKTALRDQNGLLPILDLIKSEYPVIQHLALVALQRATEDADNRVALRELEGVARLIDFIGKPEWSDLHVFAVTVLANCLEDPKTMELVKESGGLTRLVAFITDVAPPEEEDGKKGKKADKGASRAGKKGKGDDADSQRSTPKPYEKHKGKGEADAVVATLPEVKEHAAKAVARAAKNGDNRKLLHEQEAEKMLVLLLGHDDCAVQVAAAQALGVMAENLLSREAIGQWEGIEPLVKLCKSDSAEVREAASMALANLTTANAYNCNEVHNRHGVEPLIAMLADSRDLAAANAALVLTNLSLDEALRSEIHRLGVVPALIPPLSAQNTAVQSKAAMAVAAFCGDAQPRAEFREGGGVEPLVKLLHSGNDDVRRSASWAVSVVAVEEAVSVDICRFGGLETLQEVQLSSTRKNAFSGVALEKLLDSNLSAKYALTGALGPMDLIGDGFFDVGQLRAGAKVVSLEEYARSELNQRRPILLVNAQPERSQSPVPQQQSELEPVEKSSRTAVTGRSSRTGRDHKASTPPPKSRLQREKEEKQREVEEQAAAAAALQREADRTTEQQPFSPPGDAALMKYVEETTDAVAPLPTTRDQVVALAQYVADKMGGTIDRGQLSNFSWELPLSQLKFDLQSNVIPIGKVKQGIHYHRALLFKALGDRLAVHASLVRGEYNRAWNVVMLSEESQTPGAPRFPPKAYLVDLIHQPGRLLDLDSPDAVGYQKL